MIFSLEALEAQKGDCLILSWGKSASEVRHVVIDGGPDEESGRVHFLNGWPSFARLTAYPRARPCQLRW